jgi:quinone-modifying oxidoreductase, subunit QmoC
MSRVNPHFANELKKFGADDFSACYNCGNCTAICALTDKNSSFPRKMIRYSVLGLEGEIQASVDPWLCYYCGDCSTTCPREADPGNLMMAIRRYLTTKYDWTGISAKLNTSKFWEITALLLLALAVLLAFVFFGGEMTTELTPEGGVKINTFAPWRTVELADWAVAAVLSFLLLSNVANMHRKVIGSQKGLKIPLKLYFTEFYEMVTNFITQKRFAKCDTEKESFLTKVKKGKHTYWLIHFLLMTSYATLFIMIVGFLGWFQTEEIHPWYQPQRLLGYYATIGLLTGIIYFTVLRLKKSTEKAKKTHFTDWTFLILLFLATVTGILLHLFRINGMPYATYYTYVIHLMIIFPMLLIEVPFSKWSHLAYRPVAIYFSNLVIKAGELEAKNKKAKNKK